MEIILSTLILWRQTALSCPPLCLHRCCISPGPAARAVWSGPSWKMRLWPTLAVLSVTTARMVSWVSLLLHSLMWVLTAQIIPKALLLPPMQEPTLWLRFSPQMQTIRLPLVTILPPSLSVRRHRIRLWQCWKTVPPAPWPFPPFLVLSTVLTARHGRTAMFSQVWTRTRAIPFWFAWRRTRTICPPVHARLLVRPLIFPWMCWKTVCPITVPSTTATASRTPTPIWLQISKVLSLSASCMSALWQTESPMRVPKLL